MVSRRQLNQRITSSSAGIPIPGARRWWSAGGGRRERGRLISLLDNYHSSGYKAIPVGGGEKTEKEERMREKERCNKSESGLDFRVRLTRWTGNEEWCSRKFEEGRSCREEWIWESRGSRRAFSYRGGGLQCVTRHYRIRQ